MVRGRPRKPSEGLCPNPKCRKPGSPFGKYVPRNDLKDRYYYPWFRHEDGTKDCNLSKILGKYKGRQKIAVEFNRSKNETTDYHYYRRHRHKFLKEFPLKEAHISKTLPLVVYDLEKLGQNHTIPNFMGMCYQCYGHCTHIHDIRCHFCNNTTIVWCPKCQLHCDFSRKVPSINGTTFEKDTIRNELKKSNVKVAELTDINWFLETSNRITKRASNFLKQLSKRSVIVTYGDNAYKNAERISKLYTCETIHLIDKFGILDKFESKITKRDMLSKSCKTAYDKPSYTLPEPKDYPSIHQSIK